MRGGGRIFAIGNYMNQRLLKPFHDWLMTVLRQIPMDGTFNQRKPLDLLVGKMTTLSYDLKSATDRWPLLIMYEMVCYLFDRGFASATVKAALAHNIFQVPFIKSKQGVLFYGRTTTRILLLYDGEGLHPFSSDMPQVPSACEFDLRVADRAS
ncbi:hypothetical protein U1Q18_052853 [Sarracenia purpurea var. burkii]